jgi:hypothetical protein
MRKTGVAGAGLGVQAGWVESVFICDTDWERVVCCTVRSDKFFGKGRLRKVDWISLTCLYNLII